MTLGAVGAGTQAPRVGATNAGSDEHSPTSIGEVHDGGNGDPEGQRRNFTGPHLQQELAKLHD